MCCAGRLRRWASAAWSLEQDLLDAIDFVIGGCIGVIGGATGGVPADAHGRGPLNRWLRRTETVADLLERINERYSNGRSWLWCERVEVIRGPRSTGSRRAHREDFVGDLARLSSALQDDTAEMDVLRGLLRPLYGASKTRIYLRDMIPDDEDLRSLISMAEEDCLSELIDDEDEG